MSEKKTSNVAWRNPWFLSWIGLLILVLIINFSMVYLSVSKNSRLLTEDFYEKGKAYSDNRLKLEAHKLSWQSNVTKPQKVMLNKSSHFGYHLMFESQPAAPDRVIFYAYRPSDGDADFSQEMAKVTAGYYELDVEFPLKGIWDIMISSQKADKEHNTAFTIIVRQN